MFLDAVVDFHGSDLVKPGSEVVCISVVTAWEGFKIGCQKMLLVENGEIKIVESRGIIGSREPKGILEIIDGVIMRREKKELGAFVVETDRA